MKKLKKMIEEIYDIVKKDGILAAECYVEKIEKTDPFLAIILSYYTNGWDLKMIYSLKDNWFLQLKRRTEIRSQVVLAAINSILDGDNPRITQEKLRSILGNKVIVIKYDDDNEVELEEFLLEEDLSIEDLSVIAILLGSIVRKEGLATISKYSSKIQDPIFSWFLRKLGDISKFEFFEKEYCNHLQKITKGVEKRLQNEENKNKDYEKSVNEFMNYFERSLEVWSKKFEEKRRDEAHKKGLKEGKKEGE